MDEFGWLRERGLFGRFLFFLLRGRRVRLLFYEDERGRLISLFLWLLIEYYRRGRFFLGLDFRGRFLFFEEFDRFGYFLLFFLREVDFFDERGRLLFRDWDRRDCEYFLVCY